VNGSNQETGAEADPAETNPGRFGLIWAVKPSFVSYVSRMSDGKIYIGDGVLVNTENELLFPLDQEAAENSGGTSPDAPERSFSFRGMVTFQAHFGMLSVQVKHPHVQLRGSDGELTVADSESAEGGRLKLVTFTVSGTGTRDGVQYWAAEDVRLTAAGVPVFGDTYPADEPFARLVIIIPGPGSAPADRQD
jgi:hypothetical protein